MEKGGGFREQKQSHPQRDEVIMFSLSRVKKGKKRKGVSLQNLTTVLRTKTGYELLKGTDYRRGKSSAKHGRSSKRAKDCLGALRDSYG